MSEIEKMYENAGIAPKKCSECDNNIDCGFGKDCYPLFTAEKQIELVKWLALTRPVTINKFIEGWTIEGLARNNRHYDNFENAISRYINSIYPFLNEYQRAEIKEILE